MNNAKIFIILLSMVVSIALCFIPLVAVYLCMALLVNGFKKLTGIFSCLLGLLTFVPILVLDFLQVKILGGSNASLMIKFLILALVEESIKMAVLFFISAKKSNQLAFFCYSVLSGMMLGCFETLLYMIVFNAKARWGALIIHMACAGLSGIFVYSIKKKNLLITPFIFAVLFHGVYNYFADFGDFRKYFAWIVILIALVECKFRYDVLKADLANNNINGTSLKKDDLLKGDSKEMGFKDFFGKLFGKKGEETEKDLPEQTVFNTTTVNASDFDSEKTLDAEVAPAIKDDEVGADVVASSEPVVEEKSADTKFNSFPNIDKYFSDDDVPEPVTVAAEKVAEVVETAKTVVETVEAAVEKKTRTRTSTTKADAEKTEEASAPKKRGRKVSEKSADETKTAAEKKTTTRVKKGTAKSTESAEKKTTTRVKKDSAKSTDETKAAAEKKTTTRGKKDSTKSTEETKATAEKKTTTRVKKDSAKSADEAKTTESAEKKTTTRGRKPAAKSADETKTTEVAEKKTTARGRKSVEKVVDETIAEAKSAAKSTVKKATKAAAKKVDETVADVKSAAKSTAKKATTAAKKTTDAVKKAATTKKTTTKKTEKK